MKNILRHLRQIQFNNSFHYSFDDCNSNKKKDITTVSSSTMIYKSYISESPPIIPIHSTTTSRIITYVSSSHSTNEKYFSTLYFSLTIAKLASDASSTKTMIPWSLVTRMQLSRTRSVQSGRESTTVPTMASDPSREEDILPTEII